MQWTNGSWYYADAVNSVPGDVSGANYTVLGEFLYGTGVMMTQGGGQQPEVWTRVSDGNRWWELGETFSLNLTGQYYVWYEYYWSANSYWPYTGASGGYVPMDINTFGLFTSGWACNVS